MHKITQNSRKLFSIYHRGLSPDWYLVKKKKAGNVRITFIEARSRPLLSWKSNNYYIFFRVCVCARVYAWVRVNGCPGAWACAALLIQHATRMRSSHLWPLWFHHIFRHYLINGTIFGKKLLNIKHLFWISLQPLSKTFLIVRRIQRDIVINVETSRVMYPLFLSDCNKTWILSTYFRKKMFKYHM